MDCEPSPKSIGVSLEMACLRARSIPQGPAFPPTRSVQQPLRVIVGGCAIPEVNSEFVSATFELRFGYAGGKVENVIHMYVSNFPLGPTGLQ